MVVFSRLRKFRRAVAVTGLLCLALLLVVFVYFDLGERLLGLVRPTWFYINGLTRYNFRQTDEERACFDGTAERINAPGLSQAIPRVVHFITGVDRPNPVTLVTWLAIRAAAANLGSDVEIRLHYVFLSEEGPWWPRVQRHVTLVPHNASFLDDFSALVPPPGLWHPAHKADVLRLQILREQGGIYLDTDVILLRPLDTLLEGRRDVVMGFEGGRRAGLCNAVILAKARAPFLERWYRLYDRFDDGDWNYHSVVLPAKLAAAHPDEICRLSPAAFFWPLWTDDQVAWMHRPLSGAEAARVADSIKQNGGALFPHQLAYHATGHRKHLKAATIQDIMTQDTRFTMLVRRYAREVN